MICSQSHQLKSRQSRWRGDDALVVLLRDGRLGKVLDLFAHDRDASLVGRVELEHTRVKEFGAKHLLAEREDGRAATESAHTRRVGHSDARLACACWPVEEHVGQVGAVESLAEDVDRVLLRGDLVEVLRAAASSTASATGLVTHSKRVRAYYFSTHGISRGIDAPGVGFLVSELSEGTPGAAYDLAAGAAGALSVGAAGALSCSVSLPLPLGFMSASNALRDMMT